MVQEHLLHHRWLSSRQFPSGGRTDIVASQFSVWHPNEGTCIDLQPEVILTNSNPRVNELKELLCFTAEQVHHILCYHVVVLLILLYTLIIPITCFIKMLWQKWRNKTLQSVLHGDVIKWRYWSPVNSPHKGQWRRALMFSLICAWIDGWVNNGEAGDLRRHHAHYDVIVMLSWILKNASRNVAFALLCSAPVRNPSVCG